MGERLIVWEVVVGFDLYFVDWDLLFLLGSCLYLGVDVWVVFFDLGVLLYL